MQRVLLDPVARRTFLLGDDERSPQQVVKHTVGTEQDAFSVAAMLRDGRDDLLVEPFP